MRLAAAIVIVLGTMGCRQVLGIDPAGVRGDAAGSDAGDDSSLEDAMPDTMIDAPSMVWTNIAVVPGFMAGDQDPTLTNDMLEMYFTRGQDIFFATRPTATSAWGAALIAMIQNMGGNNDQSPEITPEGLFLQFCSDRGGGGPQLDVYVVTRLSRQAAWGQPAPLMGINHPTANDVPGSANTDGSHITLSSTRNGGTDLDLYEAFRPGALGTAYDPPVRMPLSGVGEDSAPFLTNDGLTLYYAAAPSGSTQRDIYVSTRSSLTEQFTTTTPIDDLNTTANDSDPWVSPDGRDMYFASDRDGALRIWHASRP